MEVSSMPQMVVCGDCGHLLYRGTELKTADEIIQQNAGVCPSCKKKLAFKIEDVTISPMED
jgi:DNA-directed RNA polymerase subunit RPC12/RpoP